MFFKTKKALSRNFSVTGRFVITTYLLLQLYQRLRFWLNALQHIFRSVLGFPPQCTGPRRATARVRAVVPSQPLLFEILAQFLNGERGRLRVGRDPQLNESVADGLADLVPAMLAVLNEVEPVPAVAEIRVAEDGIKDDDVQLRYCVREGAKSMVEAWY